MIQPAELKRLRGFDQKRKLAELIALRIILDLWEDELPSAHIWPTSWLSQYYFRPLFQPETMVNIKCRVPRKKR